MNDQEKSQVFGLIRKIVLNMSKHAFLIMAHNEYDILNKLLLLLDDERNDIFIHYDKKCKLPPPLS